MRTLQRITALVVSFFMLFGLLSFVGMKMNPGWQIKPYHEHIKVPTSDTSIHSKLGSTTPQGRYKTKETWVNIQLAPETSIKAVIREPIGAPAKRPACLFVHGAGTGKAAEVYGDLSSALASAGITTLVPDKRLDTYTTFHRDYPAMARDYNTSLKVLRNWPQVDPNKTGIYAESEGTWITSIILANDPTVAFTVLASPPVYTGRHQIPMAAENYLQIIGAPKAIQTQIPKLMGMDFSPLDLSYADYDTLPNWNKLTQPALINYGIEDKSMPIEQGAQEIMRRAKYAGNTNMTLRYYPANHQMRVGSRLSKEGLPLDPRYTRDLENWINAVAAGTKANDWTTPMIAGSQPHQMYASAQSTKAGLVKSIGQLGIMLTASFLLPLLSLIFAIGLGIAKLHRQNHSRTNPNTFAPGLATLLSLSCLISIITVSGTFVYFYILAQHALQLQPLTEHMVRGWTGLKVLAFITLVVVSCLVTQILHVCTQKDRSYKPLHARNLNKTAYTTVRIPRAHIARGWGHWMVLILSTMGIICCLLSLTFMGLFAI